MYITSDRISRGGAIRVVEGTAGRKKGKLGVRGEKGGVEGAKVEDFDAKGCVGGERRLRKDGGGGEEEGWRVIDAVGAGVGLEGAESIVGLRSVGGACAFGRLRAGGGVGQVLD